MDEDALVATQAAVIPGGAGPVIGAGGTFTVDPSVGAEAAQSNSLAAGTGVPEPGTIALIAAALFAAAHGRSQRRRKG